MISQHNPTVISLNELGTIVSDKTIKQLLFSYNIFRSKGTNSHGGAVLTVDKKPNALPLNIHQLNCVAFQVIVKNQTYVLASIYSPPNEPVPLKTMSSLNRISKNVIIVGDLNAKHPNWGCTSMNHKGRLLAEWLENSDKYAIQNHGMKTSLRSDTTIDLVLTTPTISLSHCGTLSYIDKPSKWFTFLQQLLEALKERVTLYHQTAQQRPTLSSYLRFMLKHKHYLQNKYRHSKLEEDRIRLRSWNKLIQYELKSFRQNNWMNFISEVACPNPTHFWKTVKCLNKKLTASFSAITENGNIHTTPEEIVNCLQDHFYSRFTAPTLNMNNSIDVLAFKLWNELSNSSHKDIELACENSDLKFTAQDLKLIIRKMNTKNSSGFELNNVLSTQQSGSIPHLSTLTRVDHLMEQLTQSLRHNSLSVVVYIDFLQAFDMLWHPGLILKLQHLHCPYAYLFWIVNYFQDRITTIDYQGHLSDQIVITRGAPQGSCFEPKVYIVNLFDLPQIFEYTRKVHLYVDDLALLYSPSIYLEYIKQTDEIQTRINNDMVKLEQYADNNHQPVNKNKMEFVVYHKSVQVPKIRIVYQGQCIQQQKTFKYLDFHLDSKLSFRGMIHAQFIKLRKSYAILKYIHCAFPTYFTLKMRFFQTYTWPHLYTRQPSFACFQSPIKIG
ncbi:unnamed protein product [Rotaria magnacalcarata]|uniref:Reverse transcriptase domain-containing protein n=1 Tax=Rotaria magnacalcarata TaxID=392030 RepID=A0A815X3C3_9BILA|nr:unnamed protein product [Rotaria magnacalcarata]